MSPYQEMYGVKPSLLPAYHSKESTVDNVDQLLKKREEVQEYLKFNLQKAQQRMKRYADMKRKEKEFQIGAWVWIKLHQYKQNSLARRLNFKLSQRYYGLYRIVERIGAVAYKLDLPSDSKIHPVFHVALLKEYYGEPPEDIHLTLESITVNEVMPEVIINQRISTEAGKKFVEVLVAWKGMPREEATWERLDVLKKTLPHCNLEDKVVLVQGNINMNTEVIVEGIDEETD